MGDGGASDSSVVLHLQSMRWVCRSAYNNDLNMAVADVGFAQARFLAFNKNSVNLCQGVKREKKRGRDASGENKKADDDDVTALYARSPSRGFSGLLFDTTTCSAVR